MHKDEGVGGEEVSAGSGDRDPAVVETGVIDSGEENLGEREPKVGRRPNAPTKAEMELHYPNHAHYRSWCPDCRAGRSISRQHRKRSAEDEILGPTISLDYAFMHEGEREEGTSPVLIAVDQITKAIWALEVDAKGVDTGAGVEWLYGKLKHSGYEGVKITLRSDQEPSIVAVKDALSVRRAAPTAFIESPVRQSKMNGLVERAVRNWRDQYRTLRHQLERRIDMKIPGGCALSSWLVTWAAEVINKYRLQDCGRTAYERITQHKCKTISIGIGEKVMFQHTLIGKDDYRKAVGVFLGISDRSQSYLVGNKDGIFASANVVRMSDDEAYDPDLIREITVKFYDYLNEGVRPPPAIVPVHVPAGIKNPDTSPVIPASGGYAPRRFKITKKDLELHGHTPGCPGCVSAQADDGIRRGGHTEACRIRI